MRGRFYLIHLRNAHAQSKKSKPKAVRFLKNPDKENIQLYHTFICTKLWLRYLAKLKILYCGK